MKVNKINDRNKKTAIHYDCTKLVQLINSKQYNGILRADVEYLTHLLKFEHQFEIYGLYEVSKKNGENYLIHIPNAFLKAISNAFDPIWIENELMQQKKSEYVKRINHGISNICKNVILRKKTRIDESIFKIETTKSLYINCSFFSIAFPEKHAEQIAISGMKPIYVVYDLLPLEYPEFFWNESVPVTHIKIINAMASNNAQFIAISEDVKHKLEDFLKMINVDHKKVGIARCGVSETFKRKKSAITQNKFTIFCTIEPRKNHILLLNIWREMINSGIKNIPKLSIIGRRGWFDEDVFRILENSPAIREHVSEFNSLSDDEMINEISTSRATLFPSFGEGWGLPIVESLTMGIPVICSDIKVHRECSQGLAEYISPLDGLTWMKKIIEISNYDEKTYNEKISHISKFKPIAWSDSAEEILKIVQNQ